jgi:hypothetical protein
MGGLHALERTSRNRATSSRPGSRATTSEESAASLACAVCLRRVTTIEARVEKCGSHEHACVNPAGYHFQIGCFSSAHGCVAFGHPTSEHTWFPPYAWQVALCAGCGTHLGWLFTIADDRFHGLILDRLVEVSEA